MCEPSPQNVAPRTQRALAVAVEGAGVRCPQNTSTVAHCPFATTRVKRRFNTPFLFILGEKDDLVIPSIERADVPGLPCAISRV